MSDLIQTAINIPPVFLQQTAFDCRMRPFRGLFALIPLRSRPACFGRLTPAFGFDTMIIQGIKKGSSTQNLYTWYKTSYRQEGKITSMGQFMTYETFQEKVGGPLLTEKGNCPVTPVIQMLQGKWKLQIIYELCIQASMRFGELKKMLKPITNTMLANALKVLEADGLVHREQYNEMPPRVEYALTEKGRELLPVFYAIAQWGMKYIP